MIISVMMKTTEQRFWAKVRKTASCWLWTASTRAKGYGAFCYVRDGIAVQGRAHRYSWEIHNGTVPDGLCVLHNCPDGDNPACVNPAHLYLGTKAINNIDMIAKGRYNHSRTGLNHAPAYPRGETHPGAKLTVKDVLRIRAAHKAGESFSLISHRLSLSTSHVFHIVNRRIWTHV
jgi:hypothetical protein